MELLLVLPFMELAVVLLKVLSEVVESVVTFLLKGLDDLVTLLDDLFLMRLELIVHELDLLIGLMVDVKTLLVET